MLGTVVPRLTPGEPGERGEGEEQGEGEQARTNDRLKNSFKCETPTDVVEFACLFALSNAF